MAEKTQLRAFVLFLFVVVVSALSSASWAAVSVIPDVPGLTAASPGYTPSLGQLQGTQPWASGNYTATGSTSIGGKPLSIPAKIPLAANAGAIAKTAMRLNPTALVGTLAAGWLLEQGMEYAAGQWMKNEGGVSYYRIYHGGTAQWLKIPEQGQTWCDLTHGYATTYDGSNPATVVCKYQGSYVDGNPAQWYTPPATQVPAGEGDFDNLPDPSAAIAPELPSAPYMPHGAPVGKPVYDEGNYPLGSPYKAPDGTTVQPMATVTNNNNTTNTWNSSVTVATYNITTHNADGTPTNNPTPQPTEDKPTECESNPELAGCKPLGEFSEAPRTQTVVFDYAPEASPLGAGSCPAPIQVLGHSLSYQPACDAMTMIKPVVLGMAAVMAAFILIGGFRGAV